MNADEDQPPTIETNTTEEPVTTPSPVAAPTETPAPAATTTEAVPAKSEANTPGVVILQWLSYAFWGWLIVAIIWLLGVILTNALLEVSVGSVLPYAIAATVVLLPIAFLTDLYYRKHEPATKTGAAMVIMVIHAVLFALLAIAALIVTVFNSLNALIEDTNDIEGQLVVIYTAIGATLLYAATFIRTLNPFKSNKPVFFYSAAMVTATLIVIAFAIVGPLVQALATKDDRRIEQNLSSVSQGINEYIQTNEKLPANLNDVTYTSDAATLLVEDGLVRYKAEDSTASLFNKNRVEHRYQLCVTFKEEDRTRSSSYNYGSVLDRYTSYPRVAGHDKGEVCYKLSETVTQSAESSESNNSTGIKATIFN